MSISPGTSWIAVRPSGRTMDVRLKLLTGSRCGEFISLPPGKLLVGRDHDCDLQIEIPLVSRHHCLLVWDESGLRIRDILKIANSLALG